MLSGVESFQLKWSVESIANFSIGAGYPCRQVQLYITVRSASSGLLFFPKSEGRGKQPAPYTEYTDGAQTTYWRNLQFPVAGTQFFDAMVGWRPEAKFNQDVVFEIGIRMQRKDGGWINPVAYEHTIRNVRGYVGHGKAGLLVITNENTAEEHVEQLCAATANFEIARDIEFWNVDHKQGVEFEQVAAAFKDRMIIEIPGANLVGEKQ